MPRYGSAEDYKTDEAAQKLVFEAYETSEEALKPLREEKWKRDYFMYFAKHDPTLFKNVMGSTGWVDGSPYKSSLFIPTVLQQVETQTPRLCMGLLANDPMFVAKPLLESGQLEQELWADQSSKAVERLLHNQMVRDVRLREQLPKWTRDAILYGTKVVFLEWFKSIGSQWAVEEKMVTASNGETVPSGTYQTTKYEGRVLADQVRATGMSIWDVFPDPRGQTTRAETGRQCRYIIRKVVMDIDDLWNWIKGTEKDWWYKKPNSKRPGRQMSDTEARAQLVELQGQVEAEDCYGTCLQAAVGRLSQDQGFGWTAKKKDERLIRVLDYWEPLGGWHIIIAGLKGKAVTILREENPLHYLGFPFVFMTPVPLDGHLFGIGIVDMIEQLVHWINALTNLHMTAVINATNPIVLVDTTSGLSASELISQPFLAKDVDGAVDLEKTVSIQPYPEVSGAARQEREYAMTQLQTAGGATDFTMATGDAQRNQTARGIGYMLEQNTARFNLEVHQMGVALCELGECAHALNKQFITRDRLERFQNATGKWKYMPISVPMIQQAVELEFDARPEAANPGLRSSQFLQFAQVFGQAQNIDQDELVLEGGKMLAIPRPQRFLKTRKDHAELENEIFAQTGDMPPVLPTHNHPQHLETHKIPYTDGTYAGSSPQAQEAFQMHVMHHLQMGGMVQQGPPQGGVRMGGGVPPQPAGAPGGGGMMPQGGMGGGGLPPMPEVGMPGGGYAGQ